MNEKNILLIREATRFKGFYHATKLLVAEFGLGPVGKLKPLDGIVKVSDNGFVSIRTRDSYPEFQVVPQTKVAVVRVIGETKVLNAKGLYDFLFYNSEIAFQRLNNNAEYNWPSDQAEKLKPILLESASEIQTHVEPEKSGYYVVTVTTSVMAALMPDGRDKKGYYILVQDESVLTQVSKLYLGDCFVVTDLVQASGFRMSVKEFRKYYKITGMIN